MGAEGLSWPPRTSVRTWHTNKHIQNTSFKNQIIFKNNKSKQIILDIKRATTAREMAQQIRALAAFPKDLGSIPSTHIAAQNLL
ncbi:hypothetical protein I79_004422 [Cricetulus griseus]|uniref:Uncharacterized protein n=1 Tax=Cricetulus griseus TaxID=10029 RepID=G3H2K7_CRIGR|nr:hypothetical protein I79_004422 [Cricetulus griseus]